MAQGRYCSLDNSRIKLYQNLKVLHAVVVKKCIRVCYYFNQLLLLPLEGRLCFRLFMFVC